MQCFVYFFGKEVKKIITKKIIVVKNTLINSPFMGFSVFWY